MPRSSAGETRRRRQAPDKLLQNPTSFGRTRAISGGSIYAAKYAAALLVALGAVVLVTGFLRLFDLTGASWLAAALLPAAAIGLAGRRRAGAGGRSRRLGRAIDVVLALTLVGGTLLYRWLPDTSYDGMNYHLPSILRLAEGWNPLLSATDIRWANIYPNGIWTLFAAIGSATGSLNSGRVLKCFLVFCAAALCYRVIGGWAGHDRLGLPLTLSLVLNPVVAGQIWTFYLDDLIYLLSLCSFCLCIECLRRPRWATLLALSAGLLLLMLTKIYGIYYAAVAVLAALVCVWGSTQIRQPARTGMVMALVLVAAVMLTGWRPFITNWREHGDPVLLTADHGTYDETPINLVPLPHVLRLPLSMISKSGGGLQEPVQVKPPFWVTPREIYYMGSPDTRVAGFGPFFSAAALVSVALWCSLLRSCLTRSAEAGDRRRIARAFALAGVITGACLAFPVNWWARLIPIAWVLPILPCITVAATADRSRWTRLAVLAIIMLSFANSGLAFAGNAARTLDRWRDWQTDVRAVVDDGSILGLVPVEGTWMHLTMAYWLVQAGHAVRLVERTDCTEPGVTWRGIRLCPARSLPGGDTP